LVMDKKMSLLIPHARICSVSLLPLIIGSILRGAASLSAIYNDDLYTFV
jgi:hypothetical protein